MSKRKKMVFEFCPKCKSDDIRFNGVKRYRCKQCGWIYFHNTAAAVAVMLQYRNKLLFVVRAKDPGKGMLDLPGGFVDPGESVEQAVRREVREELYINLDDLTYWGSYPNTYCYEGITYNTCDTVFLTRCKNLPTKWNKKEIKEIKLFGPDDVNPDEIAFKSIKKAVADYIRRI
jgi:NADH pyrophosphatase NudC (nudix superfamily)